MRTRTTAAAVVVGLAALSLAACSSSTSSTSGTKAAAPASSAASTPQTSATAAAPEVPAPAGTTAPAAAATGPGGLPPKPDEATTARYIAALKAIDPEIVGDKPDRAVSRGRDQCSSVAQHPQDTAKLVELTGQRFTSPQHPQGFGTEKSTKILAAVRANICPSF